MSGLVAWVRRRLELRLLLFITLNALGFLLVSNFNDLGIHLANHESKAREIISGKIPGSNFYPPGSALLLLPFLWTGPSYYFAALCYFLFAATNIYLITRLVKNRVLRNTSRFFVTLNPYLVWLCNSSQDTVFEYFLLSSAMAAFLGKREKLAFSALFLLCLTRPSYWALILVMALLFDRMMRERDRNFLSFKRTSSILLLLFMTLTLNHFAFGSYALAGEGGLTARFSYNKYFYLTLPKFDMDVFLSKGGHMGNEQSTKKDIKGNPDLEAALRSLRENPKEVFLGKIQNLDSYLFSSQKIPSLPGEYYLAPDARTIVIGNERLSWPIILGNFVFFLMRSVWIICLIMAIALAIFYESIRRELASSRIFILIIPYFVGLFPGVLFYTETRFKIVSEMLVTPLIVWIFSEITQLNQKKLTS